MNSHAIFGLNPMWLSGIILVVVYIILILEKLNRAVIAIFGAMLMIYCGLLSQAQALEKVDFNTLWLLTGMMMLVNITAKTGVFQYVAIRSAKWVKADPFGIMLMLAGITALFSALLDNVTTVLLITPVTLLITEQLNVRAFPYLFATILASNIGGTATLIGDPPNIIIGSKNGLSFAEFIYHLTPISVIILLAVCGVLWLIHRRNLKTTQAARDAIMRFDEKEAITDVVLLKKCGLVFGLVLLGFFIGHPLHIEPGTVALSGAALLMMLAYGRQPADKQSENVHQAFTEVEWITIYFFTGLFIIAGAVEQTGLLAVLGETPIATTGGDVPKMAYAVLWVSALLSSLLYTLPFIASCLPRSSATDQRIPP